MKHTIVTYLHSMGEFEMAEEVISMHNRLEAFAGRLDKAALDAAISAAEEAIRQRDELLAALEISNFYLTAIVNGAEIDAEETNIKVCLNGDEIKVINLAETIRSAESTIARMKGSAA